MAKSLVMGMRGSVRFKWRVALAVFAAGSVLPGSAVAFAVSSSASSRSSPAPTTPSTTTTLPGLPKVPLSDTDGQNASSLLQKAIELSSVGIDTSALAAAIDATQAQMDADASIAAKAGAAAKAADAEAKSASAAAVAASSTYQGMSGAVEQAVVYLYTSGPESLPVDPEAGQSLFYAQDYAYSALSPYGILQTSQEAANLAKRAQAKSKAAAGLADRESAKAHTALAAEQGEAGRLQKELSAISSGSAAEVAADHLALASQAGRELTLATSLQFTPKTPIPAPVSTTPVALTWAFSELGKEYVWGGTGPNVFDCSGLTQYVWRQAGVSIPRVAADQDTWAVPVPLSDLLPGDLVFYGTTDIHHVGIYIGDGLMINAPHTGTVVQVSSIWWSDLAGFGRVHAAGTPVPPHQTPSRADPSTPQVVSSPGPVPSQTKPPPGWKLKPGETTPISIPGNGSGSGTGTGSTTTSTSLPTDTSTTTTTTLPSATVPDSTSTTTSDSTTTTTAGP